MQQLHLKRFVDAKPELVNLILRSIYVDDIVMGSDDIDTAKKLYRESKSIFQEGGFNLRKFSTNEPELQQFFDAADQSTLTSDSTESSEETYAKSILSGLQAESSTDQKILGVKWNVSKRLSTIQCQGNCCHSQGRSNQKRSNISCWKILRPSWISISYSHQVQNVFQGALQNGSRMG